MNFNSSMMKYLFIILMISGFFTQAQIKLDVDRSTMKISGTSSLHDWEMTVDQFDVTGTITSTEIQNLKVAVIAKSMESGRSIMNDKAYDAVKAKKYPEIIFLAKTLKINGDKISGEGSLEIGGESRKINLQVAILKNENGFMQLQGKAPLKMTDFNIEPPTAMFGTLNTGDEVIIHYNIFLTK